MEKDPTPDSIMCSQGLESASDLIGRRHRDTAAFDSEESPFDQSPAVRPPFKFLQVDMAGSPTLAPI
jgi:hypothetical protein